MKPSSNPPLCRIDMLGGLSVCIGGEVAMPLRQKVAALLAYLALHMERGATREELIDLFWPRPDPVHPTHIEGGDGGRGLFLRASNKLAPDWHRRASSSLSNALSEIRRCLKAPGSPDMPLLIADRNEVRFSPDLVITDVGKFDRMVRDIRKQGTCKDETLCLAAAAVELYNGPLLKGCDEIWMEGERERLKETFMATVRQLVRDRVEHGDFRGAIEYAQRAVDEGPDTERPYYDLIQLLMHTRQWGAAENLLAEMRRVFGELSEKAARLLEKVEAELTAQRSAPSPRPAVVADDGAEPSGIGAIPMTWTRFIGRRNALRDLSELLNDPHTRLVTVCGMGGVGKTRLALEIASRLPTHYAGRVWFVPLVGISDAALISRAVADALRLTPSLMDDPLESVIAELSREPALLILDNFEHLIEEGVEVIIRLLAALPALKLLVTSRRLVDLTAEQAFPLALMPVPGDETTLSGIEECESVRLFLDRARSRQPGYSLTESAAPAIAALSNALEGIPLAIELAAARIRVLTPEQMIAQLKDRFGLLKSAVRDLDPRHRSLEATLDWSFRLLDPELRDCLVRLSVFRGGWTLEAAAAINQTDGLEELMLLQQLSECSMIQTERVGDHVRFHMLETVREFASMHRNPEEEPELRRLHLDHYLAFAVTNKPNQDSPDASAKIERIDVDLDNIRSALAFGCSSVGDPDKTARLATALYHYWKQRGRYTEGRRWFAATTAERDLLTIPTLTEALHHAGALALAQGDYAAAQDLLESSLELRRAQGDEPSVAATLLNLGVVAFHRQEDDRAAAYLTEGIAIQRTRQDWNTVAGGLLWRAQLAQRRGELEEARSFLSEGLLHYKQVGSTAGCAYALNSMGVMAHDQGDAAGALELFEQSLTLHREVQNRDEIAHTLNNCGNALRDLGRLTEAESALLEGADLWRELENESDLALTLITLGMTQCALGSYDEALQSYFDSWSRYQVNDDRKGLVYVLQGVAEVVLNTSRAHHAVALLAQAQRLMDERPIAFLAADLREWNSVLERARLTLSGSDFEDAWLTGYALPIPKQISALEPR